MISKCSNHKSNRDKFKSNPNPNYVIPNLVFESYHHMIRSWVESNRDLELPFTTGQPSTSALSSERYVCKVRKIKQDCHFGMTHNSRLSPFHWLANSHWRKGGSTLGWGTAPIIALAPKCDMKHCLTNSKCKRSVLWPSKYAKMRFQPDSRPARLLWEAHDPPCLLIGWEGTPPSHTTPHSAS